MSMGKSAVWGFGFLVGLATVLQATNYTYYVDRDAPSGGTGVAGSPWQALSNAVLAVNALSGDHSFTINVASGVYADVSNGGLEEFGVAAAYTLTNKAASLNGADPRMVALVGGFAGYTGSGYDWGTRTLRSAVIDLQGANARALTVVGSNASLSVNGFVFMNGNVTGNGGALSMNSPGTGGNYGSLQLNHCVFSNNTATGKGGAIYSFNLGSSTYTWRTNEFRGNRAAEGGAVRFASQAGKALSFADCIFSGNLATNGNGGVLLIGDGNYGLAVLTRCLATDNAAVTNGGVTYRAGGNTADTLSFIRCTLMRNTAASGSVAYDNKFGYQSLTNCLVASNTASASGFTLVMNAGAGGATGGSMVLRHCTVANNTGGGVYCQNYNGANNGDLDVRNCIVANNGAVGIQTDDLTPTVDYNDVLGHTANYTGLSAGAHDVSSDPQFTTILGNPYMLQGTSPCLDSGTNLALNNDLLGAPRPQRAGVDMGAYEESFLPLVTNLAPVVGSDKAILRGQLTYDGQTNCLVRFYWGPADGVTNKAGWATNETVGTMRQGVFETLLQGLTPGQTYYYRTFASNWYDEAWAASSTVFTALSNVHTALWVCATTNPAASNPTNWSGTLAPTRLSVIQLDASSQSNLLWDAAASAEVWGWDQRAGYTGTVTIGTMYPSRGSFTNFSIYAECVVSGGVWKHEANNGGADRRWSRLAVSVGGDFTLASGATINCDGIGYRDLSGPGAPGCHGGQGGNLYYATLPSQTYGEIKAPVELGSGGKWGGSNNGHGGGSVGLSIRGNALIDGTISVLPANVANPFGAGGSIWIRAGSLSGTGLLDASAVQNQYGAGGGRIAVIVTDSATFGSVRMKAYGAPYTPGAAGTIYKESTDYASDRGMLLIDNYTNNNATYGVPYYAYASTLMPRAGAYNRAVNLSEFAQIIVTNRGVLGINTDTVFALGTDPVVWCGRTNSYLAIRGTNALTMADPLVISNYTMLVDVPLDAPGSWVVTTQGCLAASIQRNLVGQTDAGGTPMHTPLTLSLGGNLTVDPGALITMSGGGFACGGGLGRAMVNPPVRGASHGGQGGAGISTGMLNWTYGSVTNPATAGSGGQWGSDNLADGGGVMRLTVNGDTVVNGAITATGLVTDAQAGGSIFLRTGTLSGSGLIDASGYSGGAWGGGGGRVALYLTNGVSRGGVRVRVFGGDGGYDGAAGTLYEQQQGQNPGAGTLWIDNNSLANATNAFTYLPAATNSSASELELATLVITNAGRARISTNMTVKNLWTYPGTVLDLSSNTLTIRSRPHALGGTVTNYGAIVWLGSGAGTVILVQ